MPRSGLSVVAAGALAVAGAAAVVLDAVAPGAGPLVQPLSAFAHTPYAWLWRLAVGAAATALLLLAGALRPRATGPAFLWGLVAAGVGLAAAGVCPADLWFPWERPPTVVGGLHVAAVLLVLVAFAVAMGRRARSLPRDRGGAWLRAWELSYGLSLAGALVYLGAAAVAGRPPRLFGLWERLVLASALLWSGRLATGARRPAPGHPNRTPASVAERAGADERTALRPCGER